jgi:23S rRNA (uracil1939-C5)-methyltransferase
MKAIMKIKSKCVDISSEGKGIVKANNMVILVDGLLLGEEADIEVMYSRAGVYYGRITKLYNLSKERIKPNCPVSTACGGCTFQNTTYKYELAYKKKKVEEALKRIAKIDVKVDDVVGMDNPTHYRNKIQVPFGTENKHVVYGFYKSNTHKIIPIQSCDIEDELAGPILKTIAALMESMKIAPYNEDSRRGIIRHVLIRTSHEHRCVMVVLITNSKTFPSRNNFVKALVKQHPEIVSVVQNTNLRDTNVILGEKEEILYGKGYIEDSILGVKFHISPKSFFQVNPIQVEKLYSLAIEHANITKNDAVLDAYAGVATIGILCAKHAKHVTSVELVKEACINAKENAKRNNVDNITILNEDCTEYLLNNKTSFDVVILDPPRKGSTEQFLRALMKNKPTRIVYISCEPSTLARDLAILKEQYDVTQVTPVDMFPRSFHVETIVGLALKK